MSYLKKPAWFWLIPLLVCLLKIIPFVYSYVVELPEDKSVLHVGYNPKDTLAYLSYIQQYQEGNSVLCENKYLLSEQQPRFVFIYFYVIAFVAQMVSASAELLFELSRIPLIFLFFAVLWWFLELFFAEKSKRLCCCVLVAFSGGLEGFVHLIQDKILPPLLAEDVYMGTRNYLGWNTFDGLYNPLWVLALVLMMVVLKAIFKPQGPEDRFDYACIALGFFILFWVHPYTAIATLCLSFAEPVYCALMGFELPWKKYKKILLCLLPPLLLCGAAAVWQRQDDVYKASTSLATGSDDRSVFWYPLTLAVLGVFAIRGLMTWIKQGHHSRHVVIAWLMVVVFLHTSRLTNGYHYVLYLHLPVCVLAAGHVLKVFQQSKWFLRIVLSVMLFSSCVLVTLRSVNDVKTRNVYNRHYDKVLELLKQAPKGHVLAPPTKLGLMIPAYSAHKVWVGHWALTPSYDKRSQAYYAMMTNAPLNNSRGFELLKQVIKTKKINYIVLPNSKTAALSQFLGKRVKGKVATPVFDILVLQQ